MKVTGSSYASAILLGSQVVGKIANGISKMENYERRQDDQKLQERLAQQKIAFIDKSIAAAEIRQEIAEKDLINHELQIENAQKADEFMRNKFAN